MGVELLTLDLLLSTRPTINKENFIIKFKIVSNHVNCILPLFDEYLNFENSRKVYKSQIEVLNMINFSQIL